jgi:hypothetical protein
MPRLTVAMFAPPARAFGLFGSGGAIKVLDSADAAGVVKPPP